MNKLIINETWNKPYNENNNNLINMITIKGESNKKKNIERKPLNICLVIDISSSMNEVAVKSNSMINNDHNLFFNDKNLNQYSSKKNKDIISNLINNSLAMPRGKSKLDLVKEAVYSAIELLKEDDYVSVVIFSDKASIKVEPLLMTEENKRKVIFEVSNLKPSGCTAMFDGWSLGVESVNLKKNNNYNNRVFLLTDGQATDKQQYPNDVFFNNSEIIKNNFGISTSTFGVGDSYDEEFLLGLSTKSDGNYYYLDVSDNNFDYKNIFNQEINELSNLYGKNVRLSFKGHDINNLELLNDFQKDNQGLYILPNINTINEIKILFKGDVLNQNAKITVDIIYDELSSGLNVIKSKDIIVDSSNVNYNNDLVEQEALKLTLAKMQDNAYSQIKKGNIEKAKGLLKDARFLLDNLDEKERTKMEYSINRAENSLNVGNLDIAAKTMYFSSYSTINSR